MKISPPKKWRAVDSAIVLLPFAAIAFLLHGAAELEYHWNWLAPLQYIFYETDSGWEPGLLLDGLMMSVRLLLFGGALALLLGALIAAAAVSPLAIFRRMARLYVEGLRHLPPIVFIFIFFYFISAQIFTTDAWRAFASSDVADSPLVRVLFGPAARLENLFGGLLCLALFEAAFFAEIIRAGVLSIDKGQWDGARSLSLSRWQTWRLIILPQVVSRVAAPLAGQFILLIKDSAILSVISVQELTFSAQETAVSTRQVLETWMLAAGFYFMLCYPLVALVKRLEKSH